MCFIVGIIVSSCSKYEGQTAQEWFDEYRQADYEYRTIKSEYDELKSCVDSAFHDTAEEIKSSCL